MTSGWPGIEPDYFKISSPRKRDHSKIIIFLKKMGQAWGAILAKLQFVALSETHTDSVAKALTIGLAVIYF